MSQNLPYFNRLVVSKTLTTDTRPPRAPHLMVCAWCELRAGIRHFRTDRIVSAEMLDERFTIPEAVIAQWAAEREEH
jgi:WYL domain